MVERRIHFRRDLTYDLQVFDQSTDEFLGHITDISPEGVRLICKSPREAGAAYKMRMLLPVEIAGTDHVSFDAVSRWWKMNGHTQYSEGGLRLNGVGPKEAAIIKHLCSDRGLEAPNRLNIKRIVDFTAALFGLIILSPLLIAISIVIMIHSKGPALYVAERVGRFGLGFRMYKFRTMTEPKGRNGPRVTAHDDPRVSGVGRLLRKTKLNELPQLIHVLKGEMSLVGPRPEYVEFVAQYTPEQREVLSVRPGITSLASIAYVDEEKMLNYSGVTDTYLRQILPEKLQLDLLYVRNRSLLLDLDILLQTLSVLVPLMRRATPEVENLSVAPFKLARQYLPWFVIDALVAFGAITLAGILWQSASALAADPVRGIVSALIITGVFSITNWITGVQRVHWRVASPAEAVHVVFSAAVATGFTLILNTFAPPPGLPTQLLILSGVLATIGFVMSRYPRQVLAGLKASANTFLSRPTTGRERILVVGAGDAGQLTISLLRNNPAGRAFHVVGVVDDDMHLLGVLVHRVPVLGHCNRIPEIARDNDIGTIVFAIHNVDKSTREQILKLCLQTGARTVLVPNLLGGLHQPLKTNGEGQNFSRGDIGELPYRSAGENWEFDRGEQLPVLGRDEMKSEMTRDQGTPHELGTKVDDADDSSRTKGPVEHDTASSISGD